MFNLSVVGMMAGVRRARLVWYLWYFGLVRPDKYHPVIRAFPEAAITWSILLFLPWVPYDDNNGYDDNLFRNASAP